MSAEAQWRSYIEEQQISGLSISAWCNRRKLRANRFYYWRQRLGLVSDSVEGGSFVRVGESRELELLVGEQVKIRVSANFDRALLKSVLEALGC